MKKSGQQTYLNEDKESLVVSLAKIEGGRGLPLGSRGVAHKLNNFSKAVHYRCGDYEIKDKSSMRYLWEVINRVNKKEDEHENKKN